MKKTLFSKHIPFASINQKDVEAINKDIALFNRIKHTATRRKSISCLSEEGTKTADKPDLRRKENAELRKSLPKSMHVQLKEEFGTEDHFTNSALRSANATIRSAKELKQMNLERVESDINDITAKLKEKKKRLKALTNIQASLVKRSKAKRDGRRIPVPCSNPIEVYKDGKWYITCFGKTVSIYDNDYLFEIRYLRPKIRQLSGTIKSLIFRKNRLEHKLSRMNEDKSVHICYGKKDFFRKQFTVYENQHNVWLSGFQKRRNRFLTISGRQEANGGNYLFHYDPLSHTLSYRSQTGKRTIAIPNVVFPYGQPDVDRAVTAKKPERNAVAWSIEIHGQSFIIKCMIEAVPDKHINDDYSNGCIGVDSNYGCLAVTETDGSGNLLHHLVIPIDVTGKSGSNEQSVSKALDQVFTLCEKSHKPFAMESLSMKSKPHLYGGKKQNRHISLFSADTITWLAEGKALRHEVACVFVNPAYTSQIGKIKYMRRFGLTVHEAASFAIARRAMGIHTERLPAWMRKDPAVKKKLAAKNANRNVWKAVYPMTKKITPAERMKGPCPSFA